VVQCAGKETGVLQGEVGHIFYPALRPHSNHRLERNEKMAGIAKKIGACSTSEPC
jgi:hypothetical protein